MYRKVRMVIGKTLNGERESLGGNSNDIIPSTAGEHLWLADLC